MKSTDKPKKHYFFLNPYEDCAFTKCPKCDKRTFLRKFPLVIHVEPKQFLILNKECKYCTKCDLIITKKSQVEALMCGALENITPSIIGNEYFIFGTIDRSDWQNYGKTTTYPNEAINNVYVFKDVLNFEIVSGGWYKDNDER